MPSADLSRARVTSRTWISSEREGLGETCGSHAIISLLMQPYGYGNRCRDLGFRAQVGAAHFGNKFLFGINRRSRRGAVGDTFAIQPRLVPRAVDVMPISA